MNDQDHCPLPRGERRQAHDERGEAVADDELLRRPLEDGLLSTREVAREIGGDVRLPPLHRHRERAAAVEALRREGAECPPHDPRTVRRLPACPRLPATRTRRDSGPDGGEPAPFSVSSALTTRPSTPAEGVQGVQKVS